MNIRSLRIAFFLSLSPLAPNAGAQDIGYPPDRSPFRDLEYRHQLSISAGQFLAGADPLGVAPQDGLSLGLRYDASVGGPVSLFLRLTQVQSERRGVDPTAPAASRDLGMHSWPLYLADFGMSVNITGQKSWHRIVPIVNAGIGIASDASRSLENDPYRFGTSFAFIYGAGLRFVPGGRYQIRLEVDNYLYRLKYPAQYYVAAEDGTTVADADQARGLWKNNTAITIGGSYLLFR